jgi:thiosulfate/3-mercaptopyruvate sulfurtransferase
MLRVAGEVDEPRPGLNRGHIPHAVNMNFENLLATVNVRIDHSDGSAANITVKPFKSAEEIRDLFASIGIVNADIHTERPIVLSCGSGVTACILMFACQVCYSVMSLLVVLSDFLESCGASVNSCNPSI